MRAASSRSRAINALRTLDAYHLAPPRAVGTPSPFSRFAIARTPSPSPRSSRMRSVTGLGAAARPRGRPARRSASCFSICRSLMRRYSKRAAIASADATSSPAGVVVSSPQSSATSAPTLTLGALHQAEDVGAGAAEPVDLGDDDPAGTLRLDVSDSRSQATPALHARARLAGVLVPRGELEIVRAGVAVDRLTLRVHPDARRCLRRGGDADVGDEREHASNSSHATTIQ